VNTVFKRYAARVGVVAAAVAAAGAFAAGPAMAAEDPGANLGSLSFSPSSGVGQTNFSLVTSGGCPSGATNIVGFINSAANGWTDVVLVSNTSNNISTTGSFTVGVSNNLANTANANTLVLGPGRYDIFLRCQNRLATTNFGSFSGSINVGAAPGGDFTQAPYSTVVTNVDTTTSNVTATPNSGASGSAIALSASVAANSGSAIPTGEVDFFDGANQVGTATLDGTGLASTSTSGLGIGAHSITAKYVGATGFNASQSATGTPVTITAGAPVLTVKVNGTAVTSPATASATDTVLLSASVGGAGTCEFFDGTTSLGTAPASAGTCSKSLGSLPAKAYSFTAAFTPTGSATVSSAAFALTVNAASTGGAVTENINVTVPAGGLTISLNDGQDGEVNLSTPTLRPEGDYLTAGGSLDPVKVVDTRVGSAAGWEVRGALTGDFTGQDVSNTGASIKAENLGWSPSAPFATSANQVITPGPVVAPATPPLESSAASTGDGLASSRVLATASSGHARGTAVLGADLALTIPTSTLSGAYPAHLPPTDS
jgi:hypothetical protein